MYSSLTLHAQGRPAMVNFNGTKYHYLYNLQGDIVGIVDASGNIVVEYKYDAWGKIIARTGSLASTLGYLNLFKYRGYIYDEETGMYYLFNRYYHPELQRFISADIDTIGHQSRRRNLFRQERLEVIRGIILRVLKDIRNWLLTPITSTFVHLRSICGNILEIGEM